MNIGALIELFKRGGGISHDEMRAFLGDFHSTWPTMTSAAKGNLQSAKEFHQSLIPDWCYSVCNSTACVFRKDEHGKVIKPSFFYEGEEPSRAWVLCVLDAKKWELEQCNPNNNQWHESSTKTIPSSSGCNGKSVPHLKLVTPQAELIAESQS